MQYIVEHIDWMSVKLNGLAILMAAITGQEVALGFAIIASASTIFYNAYRFIKDLKNKK